MADIFISYSKGSRAQAERLTKDLQAKGFTVWYDTRLIAGDNYRDAIISELAKARAAIVIWTAESVKSSWVCSEASRAHARRILIPVRVDDVRSHDIPPPFDTLHTELLSNRGAIDAALARLGVTPGPATSGGAVRHPLAAEPPESERKFVTILRADLVQSTDLVADLDPEQALSRLEPALAAMRAAVRRFGGIVSRETGDGLAAVFGAPLADDNHAPLACHAAVELVRRVAGLGDAELRVRVGIHSGLVVTHVVISEYSKVYELGGPAHHLAARLESAAEPGQIYASEACKALAEGHVLFDYVGAKVLKGFTKPVPVYRVAGVADLSSWRVRKARNVSPFVGRSSEMAFLRGAADDSLKSGQAICLFAEPGVGKSRLVHEFLRELAADGWRLIEAECSPTLQALPFAMLKNLLHSVLGPYQAEAKSSCRTDPRNGLPQIWRSAVDAVLDLPFSDTQWDECEPQVRGRAIADASRAVIENIAQGQRTVLLIEDLHWVDSASDSVIESIAKLTARHHLLIIVTSRPNVAPDWLISSKMTRLWLRPLDDDDGRAMLDGILGPSPSTFELKSRISRHTGNIPLFVEEVCRRLKESGIIEGEWGDLALSGPLDDLGIPATIHGVIASRIDRLSKDERALLQIAAAIGPRTSIATLQEVSGLPEPVLHRHLAVLDRAELLIEAELVPEHVYAFPHDLVRQVTYESMLGPIRTGLHRRILAALESDANTQPDVLCHHASRAADWPKALAHGRSVARKCVARSAFADATSYFGIAMDALDRMPMSRDRETEAIDLRLEARMAYSGFGRTVRWLELGKEAEQRAEAIGDSERKIRAMVVRGGALNFCGAPLEAIATGEQLVHLTEQLGDVAWRNFADYSLGQAFFVAGRCRDAEKVLERVCTQLMEPDARVPIGTTVQSSLLLCCMMKCAAHTILGEFDRAEYYQRLAQRSVGDDNRVIDRVAVAYSSGMLLLAQGDAARASTILEEALALAMQHDVRLFLPIVACQCGMAYLEQGRLDAARNVLAQARDSAELIGYTSALLRATTYYALTECRLGNGEGAREMLRSVRATARQQGFEGLEAEACFAEAQILAMAPPPHDMAKITSCLGQSIEISTRTEAKPLLIKAQALLDRVLAGADDVDSRRGGGSGPCCSDQPPTHPT
jgi:class 3 adenylate cyclase/tetratricopeptide (TPR) repeat protein